MRTLWVAIAVSVLPGVGAAQAWRDQLKGDVVVIQAGKMVFDRIGLYKLSVAGYPPGQVQVKVHTEAPVGGIVSRDNFIAITSMMVTSVFLGVLSETYRVPASTFLQGVEYTELSAPIGTPDLELNLVMTNEGLQLEVVNTASGERSRDTMTWAEIYGQ